MNIPVSFEFFPPKTAEGREKLRQVSRVLAEKNPEFFSVTFGAGGTTQSGTFDALKQLQADTNIPVAAHLTCIGATKESLKILLNQYLQNNIRRIVALRGDLPNGMNDPREFAYAADLVRFIRAEYGDQFHIEIAAYPEMHPAALNFTQDLANFANKARAGANSAITQYFFSLNSYLLFKNNIEKMGVNIPVIPGIMPITNFAGLQRFSQSCGADIPRWLGARLADYEAAQDTVSLRAFGADVMADLCRDLLQNGAPNLHFYTLNQAEPCLNILQKI